MNGNRNGLPGQPAARSYEQAQHDIIQRNSATSIYGYRPRAADVIDGAGGHHIDPAAYAVQVAAAAKAQQALREQLEREYPHGRWVGHDCFDATPKPE